MARISNLEAFNTNRQDLIKIKNIKDDIILFTKDEAREALIEYIDEELDLISNGVIQRRVNDIKDSIDKRLTLFENKLEKHISEKINQITERIFTNATSSIFEKKVSEKLDEKLNSLKKML